jgi:hypothetical protein
MRKSIVIMFVMAVVAMVCLSSSVMAESEKNEEVQFRGYAHHGAMRMRMEGKHIEARFSSKDIINLVKGVVSGFSSNFHWITCAGDAYSIYTHSLDLFHQVEHLRWGDWSNDVGVCKSALGDVSSLLQSVDSAMTACDIRDVSIAIGSACAKLSSWIGEAEEAVTVATHVVDFVQDALDIVEGIEKSNWFEVGQGIGGLIHLLA